MESEEYVFMASTVEGKGNWHIWNYNTASSWNITPHLDSLENAVPDNTWVQTASRQYIYANHRGRITIHQGNKCMVFNDVLHICEASKILLRGSWLNTQKVHMRTDNGNFCLIHNNKTVWNVVDNDSRLLIMNNTAEKAYYSAEVNNWQMIYGRAPLSALKKMKESRPLQHTGHWHCKACKLNKFIKAPSPGQNNIQTWKVGILVHLDIYRLVGVIAFNKLQYCCPFINNTSEIILVWLIHEKAATLEAVFDIITLPQSQTE